MLAIERLRLTLPRFVESEPSGHVVSHVLIANPKAPYPTKAPFLYPRSFDDSRCWLNPLAGRLSSRSNFSPLAKRRTAVSVSVPKIPLRQRR